ncbi:bifunctional oligoribonuclease/PAP phosphatase NrnA [Spirochaetota bacterium]
MDIKTAIKKSGIIGFLNNYSTYIIAGHKEPDGDCVGSQLALALFLQRLGKKTVLLSAGPFSRTEISGFEKWFSCNLDNHEFDEKNSAIIVLDCSSISRTGSIEKILPPSLDIAVIDHHAIGNKEEERTPKTSLVYPSAPAVTYIIQLIMESMQEEPNKEEAELLFFGLCTDTGYFRHLNEEAADVFHAAGRLVKAGASPKKAFEMMNGGKPFSSRKLIAEILSRTQAYYDGQLLVSYVGLDDMEKYGLVSRDSDMVYQLLLTVAGMEVAVIVRQESTDNCSVGFRSKNKIDVAKIASAFGGGGHKLAAGLYIQGRMEDIKEKIIAVFEPVFCLKEQDS